MLNLLSLPFYKLSPNAGLYAPAASSCCRSACTRFPSVSSSTLNFVAEVVETSAWRCKGPRSWQPRTLMLSLESLSNITGQRSSDVIVFTGWRQLRARYVTRQRSADVIVFTGWRQLRALYVTRQQSADVIVFTGWRQLRARWFEQWSGLFQS